MLKSLPLNNPRDWSWAGALRPVPGVALHAPGGIAPPSSIDPGAVSRGHTST